MRLDSPQTRFKRGIIHRQLSFQVLNAFNVLLYNFVEWRALWRALWRARLGRNSIRLPLPMRIHGTIGLAELSRKMFEKASVNYVIVVG